MPARSRRRSSCSASCRRASPGPISTLPAWPGRTKATARRRRAPRPMACACSTRGSPKITSADGVMATEVNFYHLTRSSLEAALPRLLAKTLQAGARARGSLGARPRAIGKGGRLQAVLRVVRRSRRDGCRRVARALEGLQGGGPHRRLLAADTERRLGEEGLVAFRFGARTSQRK